MCLGVLDKFAKYFPSFARSFLKNILKPLLTLFYYKRERKNKMISLLKLLNKNISKENLDICALKSKIIKTQ